jgi:hypothetical protein
MMMADDWTETINNIIGENSMTCHLTLTAKTGPSRQLTATVFTNITQLEVDIVREIVKFTSNGLKNEFDLHSIATFTSTITAGDNAIVISE